MNFTLNKIKKLTII